MDEVTRELAAINQQLAELTQRKRLLLRLVLNSRHALALRRPVLTNRAPPASSR